MNKNMKIFRGIHHVRNKKKKSNKIENNFAVDKDKNEEMNVKEVAN